jgi:Spondin_N
MMLCSFTLWRKGDMSNKGIQEIAELGSGMAFMSEVEACGDSCGMGAGLPCTPMNGECMVNGMVKVTEDYPYISTASMLAPSPDWCALRNCCVALA